MTVISVCDARAGNTPKSMTSEAQKKCIRAHTPRRAGRSDTDKLEQSFFPLSTVDGGGKEGGMYL